MKLYRSLVWWTTLCLMLALILALPKNSEDNSNSLIKVYRRAVSTLMWHRRFHTTNQTFKLIKIQASSGQKSCRKQNGFGSCREKSQRSEWTSYSSSHAKRFNPSNVLTNQQQACGCTVRYPRETVVMQSQQKNRTTAMADFWVEREEEHMNLFEALPCLDDTTHTNCLSTVCPQFVYRFPWTRRAEYSLWGLLCGSAHVTS